MSSSCHLDLGKLEHVESLTYDNGILSDSVFYIGKNITHSINGSTFNCHIYLFKKSLYLGHGRCCIIAGEERKLMIYSIEHLRFYI